MSAVGDRPVPRGDFRAWTLTIPSVGNVGQSPTYLLESIVTLWSIQLHVVAVVGDDQGTYSAHAIGVSRIRDPRPSDAPF